MIDTILHTSNSSLFDNVDNRKRVPSYMHRIIHAREILVTKMRTHLTTMDSMLYSVETRTSIMNVVRDTELKNALLDPEKTRQSVYRYHIKGGNSLFLIVQYLEKKYGKLINSSVPVLPEGDWDTSLFINPEINDDDFKVVIDTLIPKVLKVMADISRDISSTEDYALSIEAALENAQERLEDLKLNEFLEYDYVFSKDTMKLGILNMPDDYVDALRKSIGKSGAGTYISSNPKPFEGAEFYLARILANVFAKHKSMKKQVRMPVEIFDFSIPYKGAHLTESWEAYSEYRIQHNTDDFRVLSPVAMYYNLVKCLKLNTAASRTNKIEKRTKRLNCVLREMIVSYGKLNTTIQNNIRRHMRSNKHIGNVIRDMVHKINERSENTTNILSYDEEHDAPKIDAMKLPPTPRSD